METVEKSLEVNRPVTQVYNQWTQFETFPEFMEGVEEVRQLDNKRLHWKVKIGGKTKEWEAEIFEQTPDQVIAWRSTSGTMNTGIVTFSALSPDQTRITMRINYEPEGVVEHVGDALGLVSGRVTGDLKRFKEFIEKRVFETGGWRGEIHGEDVNADGTELR